jgi:hypothetical protein
VTSTLILKRGDPSRRRDNDYDVLEDGVGVAGSPGKDEQCANAGLEKVKAALE